MMDVEEWRDSFEMSSGNNFHSSAMPPSPMSVSTWSCDPSAQLLRLNGLKHKDQKKKRLLPASGCQGSLESQPENHCGQAALIPATPKVISHQP